MPKTGPTYECPDCGTEVMVIKKPHDGIEMDAPTCGCGAPMQSEKSYLRW